MKTIISGSRGINNIEVVRAAMSAARELGIVPTSIISGTAPGVDRLGEQWATEQGLPITRMPADWTKHGRGAGHRRNADMAAVADALVAVWDGRSPGTKGMIKIFQGKRADAPVFVSKPSLL